MATVPTYDTPQVTEAPLPTARQESIASPGLFDAGGAQLERFGGSAVKAGGDALTIAADMQTRQNLDMIMRAETGAKTDYIAYEQQAQQRHGQNAKQVTTDTADWWDKRIAAGADNLENPLQQQLYRQRMANIRVASLDSMSKFEAGQLRASSIESQKASVGSSINWAAANVDNPNVLAIAKNDIVKSTQALNVIEGNVGLEGQKIADKNMMENLTTYHTQIIQNLAKDNHDAKAAQEYFDANRGEINGTGYDVIQKMLDRQGGIVQAQNFVDKLAAGPTIPEAEGLAAIRDGTLTGMARQHAEIMWKERFTEKEKMTKDSQWSAANTGWKQYADGGINAVTADAWQAMDGKDELAIRAKAAADAEGKPIKTDFGMWNTLNQMSINDPKTFVDPVKNDLRRYAGVISTEDLKGFGERQRAMIADNGKSIGEIGAQLNVAHEQLGWGASDADKKGAFDNAVYKLLDTQRQQLGKDATWAQRQEVIDLAMVQGSMPGVFGTGTYTTKHYSDFVNTEEANKFIAKIPGDEKDKITAALTRAGQPVNGAAIAKLYAQKMGLPGPNAPVPLPVRPVRPPLAPPTPSPSFGPTPVEGPDGRMVLPRVPPEAQNAWDAQRLETLRRETVDEPGNADVKTELANEEKKSAARVDTAPARAEYIKASSDWDNAAELYKQAIGDATKANTRDKLRADMVRLQKIRDQKYDALTGAKNGR